MTVSRGRKIFDWTVGILLIAIGIVGLFVPVLQGILTIMAGLAILSSHSALARRLNERIKRAARDTRDRVLRREDPPPPGPSAG